MWAPCLFTGHVNVRTAGGAGLGHSVPIKLPLQEEGEQASSPQQPRTDLVFRIQNLWSRLPLSHHPSETDTQEMEGEKIKNLFIAQLALGVF